MPSGIVKDRLSSNRLSKNTYGYQPVRKDKRNLKLSDGDTPCGNMARFHLLFKMYVATFPWWLVDLSAHACDNV